MNFKLMRKDGIVGIAIPQFNEVFGDFLGFNVYTIPDEPPELCETLEVSLLASEANLRQICKELEADLIPENQ